MSECEKQLTRLYDPENGVYPRITDVQLELQKLNARIGWGLVSLLSAVALGFALK